MQNENMASTSQLNYLKTLGYTGPENITAGEASDIIRKLIAERNSQNQAAANQQQNAGYQQPSATYQQPTQQHQNTPQQYSKSDVAVVASIGLQADKLIGNLTQLADDGELFIPKNYSVGNAIKSAVFAIMNSDQAATLLACSEESKSQALTEYIVQGLDASKKQAYFIPFNGKMSMMRSYFGDSLVVKRTGLVADIYAVVIYQGDEIEIGFDDYGRKTLVKHVTRFENQDNDVIGAYAVAVGINGYKCYEFMTRKELEASWKMSKNYGEKNKLQNNFKQEAAKRTVIRRLDKMIFNTSLNTTEEQTALIGSYNRTTEDEYDDSNTITTDSVIEEAKNKTGKKQLKVDDTPEQDGWPE